ncbi:hypothetical protein PPERSA_07450 [Pseudocohnilembus persalinus]|uniref:Uncharacterized protein n=1 Tax=Pseudocohnilembus persalinus TaxID=266149 RepID=A0A0V0QAW0_PSEPJ|nr:hypothetical protein PPERSA_07450 [Pseudocohnilembus persalinus]|eukprot:KRW99207.1 hypothetical protein PPERSA_07450 [Pseudocohnilembus persalinus]
MEKFLLTLFNKKLNAYNILEAENKTENNINFRMPQKNLEYIEDDVVNIIETILNSVEDCERELQQDEVNMPFTFFSLKISIGLLQTITAGLLTFIGASVQYKIFSD